MVSVNVFKKVCTKETIVDVMHRHLRYSWAQQTNQNALTNLHHDSQQNRKRWSDTAKCREQLHTKLYVTPQTPETNTFCSDTLYVRTDPGSLPSFTEECRFGNLSLDSYH